MKEKISLSMMKIKHLMRIKTREKVLTMMTIGMNATISQSIQEADIYFNGNVKLSYAKIAKSELRMFDRRCDRVSKLFFTYKKLQTRKFSDAISINNCYTNARSRLWTIPILVKGICHSPSFRMCLKRILQTLFV